MVKNGVQDNELRSKRPLHYRQKHRPALCDQAPRPGEEIPVHGRENLLAKLKCVNMHDPCM